jgi:hypothetical protein
MLCAFKIRFPVNFPWKVGTPAACNTFELNALGEASDEVEGERRLILPMLDRAAGWPCQGELAATQVRIEHWFEGIPVPIIGFVDFALMDDIDIDLKTTKACTPAMTMKR